jgi:hypothetical protein
LEDIIDHHGSFQAFDNNLKLLFLLEPLDMQADLEVWERGAEWKEGLVGQKGGGSEISSRACCIFPHGG